MEIHKKAHHSAPNLSPEFPGLKAMKGPIMRSNGSVHVFHKSGAQEGHVSRLAWDEADELVTANKAVYISHNLYRLGKLGSDISKLLTKRPDDAEIKNRIKELGEKQSKKKAKKQEAEVAQ